MSYSLSNARVLKTEPLRPEEAKWCDLVKLTYNSAKNETAIWEAGLRKTRIKESGVDGVDVMAIVQRSNGPEILLQRQFRPPTGKVCIEMPGGVLDAGESIEECAIRELKEETGYIGTVAKIQSAVSPIMFSDSGFCNCALQVVQLDIDMNDPRNQNPESHQEADEFIENFWVRLTDLYAECVGFDKEGYAIDARVGAVAKGIEIAKSWKLN